MNGDLKPASLEQNRAGTDTVKIKFKKWMYAKQRKKKWLKGTHCFGTLG
jgi:hypothetical protein